MEPIKWVELKYTERKRTYHFADGQQVTFIDVVRIEVRLSGTHRIETSGGRKTFVRPGWLWVEIDADDWSF